MSDLNHLRILKYLNFLSAGLLGFVALLTAGSIGFTVWIVIQSAPEAAPVLLPSAVLTAITIAAIGFMAWLALVAGRGIENGQGRISQTVLAVSSLASLPLGTAYGLYALWVCWYNEPTRATFDTTNVRRELAWAGLGIAALLTPLVPLGVFSITAALPTDLEAIDARYEPLENRSQRVPSTPGACGLNEAGPACTRVETSFKTKEVSYPTRETVMGLSTLNGTLYLPDAPDGRRPAAILVHGSGPQSRHALTPGEITGAYDKPLAVFDALAADLAGQGLVVLTYDKRACAQCYPEIYENADFSDFRFQLFVEDALAGIDYLASRDDVHGDAIVVLGHSQGGGFAPHIAAADDRVVAVAMLAGFTGTFRDIVVDQLEAYADTRRAQWDVFGAWNLSIQADVMRQCLDKLDGDYDPADDCLGGGVHLQALAEYDALNSLTPAVIRDLDAPLFAVSGTVDRNVPAEEIAAIIAASGGSDAEFHLIPKMGHNLTNAIQPEEPPELHSTFLTRLSDFLSSVHFPAAPTPERSDAVTPDGLPHKP